MKRNIHIALGIIEECKGKSFIPCIPYCLLLKMEFIKIKVKDKFYKYWYEAIRQFVKGIGKGRTAVSPLLWCLYIKLNPVFRPPGRHFVFPHQPLPRNLNTDKLLPQSIRIGAIPICCFPETICPENSLFLSSLIINHKFPPSPNHCIHQESVSIRQWMCRQQPHPSVLCF